MAVRSTASSARRARPRSRSSCCGFSAPAGSRRDSLDVIETIAPLIPDAADRSSRSCPRSSTSRCGSSACRGCRRADDGVADAARAVELIAGDVEDAWFFQTGTACPISPPPNADEDDDDGRRASIDEDRLETIAEAELDPEWSDGAPPQVTRVPFPVDGYPEDPRSSSTGRTSASRSSSPATGCRARAPCCSASTRCGSRRTAGATATRPSRSIEPPRGASVGRSLRGRRARAELQVHHLLWILSRLDEVMPVVHARFGGATMDAEVRRRHGRGGEPFVLGGNPLLAIHARGGEAAVDRLDRSADRLVERGGRADAARARHRAGDR